MDKGHTIRLRTDTRFMRHITSKSMLNRLESFLRYISYRNRSWLHLFEGHANYIFPLVRWKLGLYSFNIVVQQTYHDSKMKGHWVAKLEELRRHRCQSLCVCNEPFTLGGDYVLSISDKDLERKQKNHVAG